MVVNALLPTLLLMSSVAQASEPATRVVVLDALVLPPSFQKANVRANVEQGVTETVRAHGWEPVSIATECRDLGCAGAVAKAAKTLYVLILVGRYAANDTYATDVGVSLWRDGTIVASRSETDEEAEHNNKSATGVTLRCGPPDGTCTPQLLATKLQQYAAKLLEDESAAARARVAAAVAVAPPPQPAAQATSPAVPVEDRGGGRILGWSLVGAGVLLGGGALALWAANGSKTHCNAAPGDADGCRFERRTNTAAVVAGFTAVASAAAGIVVLVVDRGPSRMALSVHPSGLSLEGRF